MDETDPTPLPIEAEPAAPETAETFAGEHQLAGTLYLPLLRRSVPAVVFVHGAGPAVRSDGYHELGRHFAGKGVAALIYDKRGCGNSTGCGGCARWMSPERA